MTDGADGSCSLLEWSCVAKGPDPAGNEDRVILGPGWFGVVDGATDKSGMRYGGRSSGVIAAEAVAECLAQAPGDQEPGLLVSDMTDALAERLERFGADPNAPTRPAAVVVCFSPSQRLLLRVGDCAYHWAGSPNAPQKLIDRINAEARAALLQALIAGGADHGELRASDPGRQMIMPLLREQGNFQNHLDHPLGFGAIDGRPVPDRYVEVTQLEGTGDLVLASDGYPTLLPELAASEQALARALGEDPLRIGTLRGTKGIAPGAASFDDRSYLRLRLRAEGGATGHESPATPGGRP